MVIQWPTNVLGNLLRVTLVKGPHNGQKLKDWQRMHQQAKAGPAVLCSLTPQAEVTLGTGTPALRPLYLL